MALSQAYLTWEKETEQRGIERVIGQGFERGFEWGFEWGFERGKRETQRATIVSILTTRFGALDAQLEAIVPALMELPIETSTPLLLQRSREELLSQFAG
jgi:flagellar biosynthesis/type III secretory pathway protein FliH